MKKYKDLIIYSIVLVVVLVFGLTKIVPLIGNFFDLRTQVNSKYSSVSDLQRQIDKHKQDEAAADSAKALEPTKQIYSSEGAGEDAETSFTVLFDDVINMAKYNGVKVYSIEYAYNPADDPFVKGASDKYNVCKLTMDLIADYADFEGFLKEIYKYPYLINFDTLRIMPYQKNKKLLLIEVSLELYTKK